MITNDAIPVARTLLLLDIKDYREAEFMKTMRFIRKNDSRFNVVLAGQLALNRSIQIQLHILDGMAGAW